MAVASNRHLALFNFDELIQYQLQIIFNFSYHIYKLSFLNFLLGRQPNGPGQFMFGTIEWGDKTTWLEGVEVKAVSQDVR